MITRNQRILGNKLALTVDGTDYWADVAEYELGAETKDSDAVTYADAAAGATQKYKLKIKAIQSTAVGSFWRKLWDSVGKECNFIIAPHANKIAASGKPHFTTSGKVPSKPTMSGQAGDEKGSTFDIEIECSEPVMIETEESTLTGNNSFEDV